MQKRQSRPKSKPKNQKKTLQNCSMCKNKISIALNLRQALYRKYSYSQNHYFLKSFEKIRSQTIQPQQEYLQRYQKKPHQKYALNRIKQIYRVHQQIPRIFHTKIRQILEKCYHRKRLIQYFRMAKIFGLPVQSVKFSTFLLSFSNQMTRIRNKDFQPIIDKISIYDFSQNIEKGLVQTMDQPNKPNLNPQLGF